MSKQTKPSQQTWNRSEKLQFSVQDIDNGSVSMMGTGQDFLPNQPLWQPKIHAQIDESRSELWPTSHF